MARPAYRSIYKVIKKEKNVITESFSHFHIYTKMIEKKKETTLHLKY